MEPRIIVPAEGYSLTVTTDSKEFMAKAVAIYPNYVEATPVETKDVYFFYNQPVEISLIKDE